MQNDPGNIFVCKIEETPEKYVEKKFGKLALHGSIVKKAFITIALN